MKYEVTHYTTEADDIFEHIVKEDDFEFNHVIIKPGFSFPKHPRDAFVIITVVKGVLSVNLEDEEGLNFQKGAVVKIPQGVLSTLSNQQDEKCELFVIKRR